MFPLAWASTNGTRFWRQLHHRVRMSYYWRNCDQPRRHQPEQPLSCHIPSQSVFAQGETSCHKPGKDAPASAGSNILPIHFGTSEKTGPHFRFHNCGCRNAKGFEQLHARHQDYFCDIRTGFFHPLAILFRAPTIFWRRLIASRGTLRMG